MTEMTKEFFERGKRIARWADNNMTKDKALKMAIEAMRSKENYFMDRAIQACKEALEQPAQEPIHNCPNCNSLFTKEIYSIPQPVALLEMLSDLEHQQWMKWAQSIIDSEPISEARKQRWLTMMVDYKDLPDNIQEYDREWARKVLAITRL